jgi:hypothetical protein
MVGTVSRFPASNMPAAHVGVTAHVGVLVTPNAKQIVAAGSKFVSWTKKSLFCVSATAKRRRARAAVVARAADARVGLLVDAETGADGVSAGAGADRVLAGRPG